MKKKKTAAVSPKQGESAFSKIKQWFVGGCVWYAIILLVPLLINTVLSYTQHVKEVPTKAFLFLYLFAFSMSGAGMLYRSKLPRWSRILSHYGISIVSFLLFVLLPAGSFSGVLVLSMLVLLSVIYWILFAIVHIFAARWKRVLEED